MRSLRILTVSLFAPVLAALPYLALLWIGFPRGERVDRAEGACWLAAAVFVVSCTIIGMIFLGLARLRWRSRHMIVREHLHAWGPCLAALWGVPIAVVCAFVSVAAISAAIGAATFAGLVGVSATRMWERYAYP
jgi:hypothetical protein